MSKPMSKMLLYVGIFFAIVFGWYGARAALFAYFMAHYEPPPVTISAVKVDTKTWQSFLTSVGTLTAINGVDLSSEVSGLVKSVHFNSGQIVKKGNVIIELDTSVEQANLKDKKAKLVLAKLNYDRIKQLYQKNFSSQAALDQQYAELLEAEAGVESVEAQINQKTITAPFDGRIGIRQVDLGQYISPGAVMVTLQALNPLYVNLTLPEQYLPVLYLNQPVDIAVNYGSDGKIVRGTITAINSKVDQATRNITIQATIPNENYALYPGMFGSAKIWLRAENNMVVVPQTAISYSLSGDYVYIIKHEGEYKGAPLLKAYRTYVKVGERRGDEASIIDGLKGGEEIITSGQLKLQNGSRVDINNSVELN